MAPSRRRTAEEAIHESDLLWLALLAYSRSASSRDLDALPATALTLEEHFEALGRRVVYDSGNEIGELGPLMQDALGGGIPLMVDEDGEAFAVVGMTWLRRAVEVLHRPPGMTFGQVVKTLPTRSDTLPRIRLRGWTEHPDYDADKSR